MARKAWEEMIGEGFRETGILVFVFAILERLILGRITIWRVVATVAISAGFFLAGCYIERRRPIE